MAKGPELIVSIITDASKAGSGIDEATGKFGKFNSVMGGLVGPAAAVLGGITALGAAGISAASDLQQAAGGTEAVFGESANQIKAWASEAASSVGLSSAAYQTFAAQLGAQLKNLGVPMDQVAGKTDEMIRLGADLAATYGGTTEEAVSALGAAFRGEADPAERYGLALNQTAVNAELAARGMTGLEGEQLNAAKAAIIMEMATAQAGGAVGQFASESDTLAGQQQRLNAQIADTAAALGEALLPVITPVVAALAEFATWVAENSTLVTVIIGVIAALAAIVLVYAAAQWVANAAMYANPVGLVIAGIVLLIAAITALVIWVANNTEAISKFFTDMWEGIVAVAETVAQWFQDVWASVAAWFMGIWASIAGFFQGIWAGIQAVIASVVSWFQGVWASIAAFFSAIWASMAAVVNAVFNGIRSVIQSVVSWFSSVWNGAVSAVASVIRTLQGIFTSVFSAIMGPINAVIGAINGIVGAIKNVISWLGRIKVPDVFGAIGGLFGASAAVTPSNAAVFTARGIGAAVPSVATYGARSAAGGTVINVYGGLDSADTTARRIAQLLKQRDQRTHGVTISRSIR